MTSESANAMSEWMQTEIAHFHESRSVMEACLRNAHKRQAILESHDRAVGFAEMIARNAAETTGENAALAAADAEMIARKAFNDIRFAVDQIFSLVLPLQAIMDGITNTGCSIAIAATRNMETAVAHVAAHSATMSESIARSACKRMFEN